MATCIHTHSKHCGIFWVSHLWMVHHHDLSDSSLVVEWTAGERDQYGTKIIIRNIQAIYY
jgi:hypothetical protein